MSSVNTVTMHKVAAGTSGNAQALSGSKTSGVVGAGGMANFWDMIIAQFGTNTDTSKIGLHAATTTQDTAQTQTADVNKKAQKQGDNSLAMLQLALSAQSVDSKGDIILTNETTAAGKIERQLDLTNSIINHLKNMLPENAEKDGMMAGILSKLQAKSDTLQASLSALEGGVIAKDTPVEDLPLPLLIALGLNPAEITEVTEKIQDMQKKLGREITVEDLIAGVGGLIPAQNNSVVALKTSGDKAVLNTIDENSQPTDDLAAQLNAMDIGAGDADKDPQAGITNLKKGDAEFSKPGAFPLDEKTSGFEVKADPNNGQVKKDAAAFKENLVNMLNSNKGQQGDMLFPASYNGADADNNVFQPYGYSATPSLSLGTSAQAANMVSSPTVAGQNHPATQLVAATLTKAGKGGEDSTINLRLDPPELGNVSVRLQFGKDKTVKAHVTVEKPETFMMLQREGHSLERALQNAGLDTQGQAISFELAQDNGTNGRQGENSDNNFGGGGKASQDASGAEDIIQSSMTWQVDSATGHMRYNIMA